MSAGDAAGSLEACCRGEVLADSAEVVVGDPQFVPAGPSTIALVQKGCAVPYDVLPGVLAPVFGQVQRCALVVPTLHFDVVLFLQSLSYATDQARTLRAVHDVLRPDGLLVVTRAHPIRFAVERAERDGIELGDAYHSTEPYEYQSRWNPDISLTHATDTFSAMHNSLVDTGFRVERIVEPQLSEEKKALYPHKQAWLARYFGIVIFRARPLT